MLQASMMPDRWSGSAETSAGINHAFITGLNGNGMIDLNSLVDLPQGVVLTEAMDINNVGAGRRHCYPEPHSYAMLLAGLSVLYALSRRRKTFSKDPSEGTTPLCIL